MKYILLLLIPLSANADCIYDAYGQAYCTQEYQPADLREYDNSPHIYENGQYRGNLNNNHLDENSVSNPMGKYGSRFSNESINNPYRSR
jgi:hypothetical protein